MASTSNEGLSMAYRIGYRLRHMALTVFGPAQLGEGEDPTARLEAERAARVANAQRQSQHQRQRQRDDRHAA